MLLGDGAYERERTAIDGRWDNSTETSGLDVAAMVAAMSGPFLLAVASEGESTMTQAELNRAVARATGESVAEVKRIGFLLAEPDIEVPDPDDEDLGPSVLDWDEFDEMRMAASERHAAFAPACV